MEDQSAGLLVLTSLLLSVAFVISTLREVRGARTLGKLVSRSCPGRGRRQLAVAFLCLLGGVVLIADTGVPTLPALQVLLLGGLMLMWTPGLRDSALGEGGVRAGWFVRPFAELEEWRLTGDHLRWRLFGEWQACEVPPDERESLRTKLEQLIPDRESRFRA